MSKKRGINLIIIISIIIIASIFSYFFFYNNIFLSPSDESEKDDPGSGQRPQFQKAAPQQICGNGILEQGEECDDGNLLAGDGCSQLCEIEEGWLCNSASPTTCAPDPVKTIFVDYQIPAQSCTNYDIAARNCAGGNYIAYKTLQGAANVIAPGKIVFAREGIYREQLNINRFGTISEWLTFKNYNREVAVIDGENTRSNGIRIEGGAGNGYMVIDGFEIKNFNSHGIHSEEISLINLKNNKIHDNGGFGVSIRGGDDVLIESNEIYSNSGEGVRSYWRDTNANKALRNIVRKNIIYSNNDVQRGGENADGIAFFSADDGIIEYNLLFSNSDDGIDVSGHSNVFSNNNIIRYNIAFYNGFPTTTNGDGNGIKISTNNGGGNIIHHNIVIGNRRAGFDQDIEPGNDANKFYNNVAYRNGLGPSDRKLGFVIEGSGTEQGRAALYNNIGWNNDPNLADRGDLYTSNRGIAVSDYNDWKRYYYASPDPGHEEGQHTISSDPRFISPDISINTNYQTQSISEKYNFIYLQIKSAFSLQQFSPAINAGTIVQGFHCPTSGSNPGQNCVEWFGNAPDMGAFEYLSL